MHLDTNNLDTLKSLIGEDLIGLLQLYLDSAPQNLQRLQNSIAQQDFSAIAHQAHELKGSAGNVGAADLSELNEQLCKLAQDQQANGMTEILQEINEEATAVETLMKDYIANFSS